MNALESRTFTEKQSPPLRFRNLVQTSARFMLPVRRSHSAVADSSIDVLVRLGHLCKACLVDNKVGAQHIE